MKTYALDFESYYDSECSITTLGPRGYFSHPNFDAYMVTVVGDDGFQYAGHPKDFDWHSLQGNTVVMHNASFDESLYLYGVEVGWYPKVDFDCHCTADMVAYLGLPRSLKNASAAVLKTEITKTTRDNMKGKQWDAMTAEFKEEVTAYAITDAVLCLRLWSELSDQWPAIERNISHLNRKVCQRGLPIDEELLHKNLGVIKQALFDAELSIPWVGDYTPLSRKAFNEQCRKQGITPPASLAQDNEDTDAWFAAHQQECPWARAVQSYRRINAFLRKLEAFDAGTMADGRYYGGLMYCGANPTARFSGSGGNLNLQNLPREEMFGVNFRHMIKPKDGHKLIVVDLSQIEVRTICWLAKDKEALKLIAESDDIYHAFGVLLGLHDPANGDLKAYDKANGTRLRHKVKAIAIGCSYGMGANKFSTFSGMELDEAQSAVNLYRERMKSVPAYWRELDEHLTMAHSLDQKLELELPSGRLLRYGNIKRMKTIGFGGKPRFSFLGKIVRNGQMRDFNLWGGILAENCLSHTAEVLTFDAGWVALSAVTLEQKVWDGIEFVSHSGFIDKGEQEVINVFGIEATPDHKFLVGGIWISAEKACNFSISEASSPSYEAQGLYTNEVWDLHRFTESRKYSQHIGIKARDKSSLGARVRVWAKSFTSLKRNKTHTNLRQRMSNSTRGDFKAKDDSWSIGTQALLCTPFYARPLQTALPSSLGQLWGSGDYSMRKMAKVFSELLGRYVSELVRRAYFRSYGQFARLQPRELQVGHIHSAGEKQAEYPIPRRDTGTFVSKRSVEKRLLLSNGPWLAPTPCSVSKDRLQKQVGDLLNCGPRNRFAVRASAGSPVLIAHNCSQGLAREIFSDMMLRIDAAGFPIILHVHDEVVCEVPEKDSEMALAKILEIMHTPPDWIPDIPVAAEGHILDLYSK